MANINVKNDGGALTPYVGTHAMSDWDPLRMARDLLRWDPFREIAPFRRFDESAFSFTPAFEVKETKESYVFQGDLPGIKEEDVEITHTGNRLTVSGKRDAEKEEQTDAFYAYERRYGSFARSFTLPDGVDAEHIGAELKDGVLRIVVPKAPEAQPKKIGLKSLGGKKS